ncbi:g-type lysozyme inhibitor [Lysobacter sp. K5869]|uniref:g-type lysozyme inhibitor n=1 Tax=Lysobacter sp. K5869 TaxID=2820808 RepID=UPI001C060DC7|nr:g-type lysozyme inhibitor [Lysobacter sp. K5869]QWP77195.1 g-type lysozyme inhibitor [Lysobacter sp. K5869]
MLVRAAALAVALSLCSSAAFAADAVKSVPVQFAKGATGATVNGAIKGYDSVEYLVVARAGQSLRTTLTGSSNAAVNVYPPRGGGASGPQAEALAVETVYGQGSATGSATLPADGEYRIQVYQPRAAARRGSVAKFSLKIEVR